MASLTGPGLYGHTVVYIKTVPLRINRETDSVPFIMEIIQDIVVQEPHKINASSLDFINSYEQYEILTFSCVIYCIKYFIRLYLKTMFSTA